MDFGVFINFLLFWHPSQFDSMIVEKSGKPNYVVDYKITFLTEPQRIVFLILYILVFAVSISANVSTIVVTIKRKMRVLQKTWIISLAASDIIVAIFLGANNIVMLSHKMNNWILGDFMCPFIPYMQNMGQIANSITMVLIAYDRYRNIVQSTNKQWNPKLWVCLVVFSAIWISSAAVVVPQFDITKNKGPFLAIITNPDNRTEAIDTEVVYFCMYGTPKERNLIFYSLIGCISFVPLMCLCLWLYYKIAQLIWRRRRPPAEKYYNNTPSVLADGSTNDEAPRNPPKSIMKSAKLRVERKVRTFKIILAIMIVFFLCRMPYWINNIFRFAKESADRPFHWILSYSFSLILILNTAINPFLYSFLNQTIAYLDKFFVTIGDCFSKICCCCCSDFDDYKKEEISNSVCDQQASQTSNILPRGPYTVNCNNCKNHVKFDDVTVVNTYPKDNLYEYNRF